jgi:hypothetical protein
VRDDPDEVAFGHGGLLPFRQDGNNGPATVSRLIAPLAAP